MEQGLTDYYNETSKRHTGAHCSYSMHYHLVWNVRARKRLLTGDIIEAFVSYIDEIPPALGLTIVAAHIEPEHVHIILVIAPTTAVMDVVQKLKGGSSHYLRRQFPHLVEAHEGSLWGKGYFIRTLGEVNVAQAKAYLDRQHSHHNTGSA